MSDELTVRKSSNIHFARYADGCLYVDFKNAQGVKVSTYRYDGTLLKGGENPTGVFPRPLFERMVESERNDEAGRFFATQGRGHR